MKTAVAEPIDFDGELDAERARSDGRSWGWEAAVLIAAVTVFAVAVANQHSGHDWGDDFSLYLHQAKSLTNGTARAVLDGNRFTVDNSSWHSFSPYSYPWGFPLLLAPLYRVFGLDYAVFKVVLAGCLAGSMWFLQRLLARRMHQLSALMIMLLIGLSPEYIGWSDTVLSEFPYLLAVFGSLWWMDRLRRQDQVEGPRWWPLIVLGLAVGYTYTVRKEGVALFAALGLMHLAHVIGRLRTSSDERLLRETVLPSSSDVAGEDAPVPDELAGLGLLRRFRWSRLATPYLVAALWIVGLQVALPNGGYQSFPGTGVGQFKPNVLWYRDILAQQVGLKKYGMNRLDLFGFETLGLIALTLVVTLAVIGLLVRSISALQADAPLIGYFVAVVVIFGITPFHEGRYLFSITPLLIYFAHQAVVFLAEVLPRPVPALIAAALIVPLLSTNLDAIWRRTQSTVKYDAVIWGPEFPSSKEMFAEVDQVAGPDDVVAFFRARLMSFYTERRALQLTSLAEISAKADWYAMAKDSTYSQILITDADAASAGLTKVWENANWVLWKVGS